MEYMNLANGIQEFVYLLSHFVSLNKTVFGEEIVAGYIIHLLISVSYCLPVANKQMSLHGD